MTAPQESEEDLIRKRAFFLWLAAGCPEGRDEEFWYRSQADEAAGEGGESVRGEDERIDEAGEESFPASDPPAFSA